jgi:UDP:flavonoid glycosyltransferase YjiC (YdhE family)
MVICLMPNCAYLSETSRMIAIYKALREAGADAVIATHGGTYEKLLQNESIPYEIVGPRMSEGRCRQFVSDNVGIGDPNQSMYSPAEMRTYVMAEADLFRKTAARAVVTGFTLTVLLSSRLVGIPVVSEHAGSYIPPLLERGMLPAASRPPQPVFNYMPRRLARWLQNKGASGLTLYLKGFNDLAAELGIEPIPSMPALLIADLALVTEAPEVYGISEADMRAWRPTGKAYRPSTRLEYTGPIFAELDLPVPDAVESVLRGRHPIVYIAVTSAPADLVRRIVTEVQGIDAQVIVAGTVHDLADLASAKLTIGGILPSHKIMPRVDVAITSGGQGSVQCAMASGIPLVGVPLQPEQDANLHFLELRGAARTLPIRDVGRDKLAGLLREIIEKPGYRKAARSIQSVYSNRDGPRLSAQAILRFVQIASERQNT